MDGLDGGRHSSVCMPCPLGASQLGDKRGAQSQSWLRTQRSSPAGQSSVEQRSKRKAPSTPTKPNHHEQQHTAPVEPSGLARPSTLPPAARTAISGSCSQLERLLLDDTELTTISRMTVDLRTNHLTEGSMGWTSPATRKQSQPSCIMPSQLTSSCFGEDVPPASLDLCLATGTLLASACGGESYGHTSRHHLS